MNKTNKQTKRGYIYLVKASWILVDIIVRHPQLNYLDSNVRILMMQLAEVGNDDYVHVSDALIRV
jgi:hypothetical protein